MAKVIILGAGAAPGVPSIAMGFGACDPNNPKNIRLRSGTYIELSGVKFLIDTSPDLRQQLLTAHIRELDAVFYTHTHADHLHGIDELRDINRVMNKAMELYASPNNLQSIRQRFPFVIADDVTHIDPMHRSALHPNAFTYGKSFMVKSLKVTPILLEGHNIEVSGYIFNDGEIVYIADFKTIPDNALQMITHRPELLVMPLTTPEGTRYHAGMESLKEYIKLINPKRTVINHMAAESDYAQVLADCPENTEPAYDGMEVVW